MSCHCNEVPPGHNRCTHPPQAACNTPCSVCLSSSAECETLPSALENFVRAFFGSVIKTEVNGVVTWTLPCNLDVGLTNNPRAADEGLACYFLRLFGDGLVGLTGPQGNTGEAGADGNNAYTVTTSAFVVPTMAAPHVQFTVIPSATVYPGLTVFIPGAGWFEVTQIFQDTTVFATLLQLITSPSATVPPGTTVLPAGNRGRDGQSIKGDKGDPGATGATGAMGATGSIGPTGAVGPAGATATNSNAQIIGGATDYPLTGAFAKVDFGAADLEATLPAGTYYFITTLNVASDAANVGNQQNCAARIFNVTDATIVDGSSHDFSLPFTVTAILGRVVVVLTAIVTINATKTFEMQAQNAGPGVNLGVVEYATSNFIWIKLA